MDQMVILAVKQEMPLLGELYSKPSVCIVSSLMPPAVAAII